MIVLVILLMVALAASMWMTKTYRSWWLEEVQKRRSLEPMRSLAHNMSAFYRGAQSRTHVHGAWCHPSADGCPDRPGM